MKNRSAGLLLIGLSLLTGVITYALGELIIAVKMSAAHVSAAVSGGDGPGIGWSGNPLITNVPLVLIACSMILGMALLKNN